MHAAAALVAAGAVLLVAACGGSDDATSTTESTSPAKTTRPSDNGEYYDWHRGRQPQPRFRGNGGETLRPITLSEESILIWTAEGLKFQIFEDELGMLVNSHASRGSTEFPVGTYSFQIKTPGAWTIRFQPLRVR